MLSVLVRPISWLLAPHPFSLPLWCHSFSPLCLSSVGACGGAWSVVPSCGAVSLAARRLFPVSVGCLLAFLVSILSAVGVAFVLRGSSRLIGAGGGTGSSACLDEADGGVCGLCGASFYRLITSVEAGILFLVP